MFAKSFLSLFPRVLCVQKLFPMQRKSISQRLIIENYHASGRG
ncbi:hypothetical protein APHWI1_0630 [Anaplasma phagocytophilum str. ApWI1]|uniref:Uncharacterized protein n=3 Tax=Anaplasma phagocytophilum TaxID=948 RepID=A0A0F3PW95_ANAPH|nr:hypothetical protein APH_1057 [Anaplasma phagocytophilum str. HZ]KJV59634.1 hypothetical protein APHWEB_0926 [Anaplasma phagocytophilum str. Webster]KJV62876.1 hypothetical protein EPHNCH_1404 [Anaplasma phagocytophilum str. NCH-1]KJV84482.1 hypothetical protein APHWI1_0590 [Anaplasma phagocytophilum str. ApWI1]KJV86793.1 hypothetical protein APHNYW_1103 [Anaplasma phagocytophilum str. ApNYW]KJV98186.1 hypothetical protein OTSANNIE_1401 [Anaplasma phagocytophilum str. Annie]KKA00196.1 hypo